MSGERGPKPLPPNVHLLKGNPSHKPIGALLDDVVRPDVEIPDCPKHLKGEARAEWKLITPELFKLGLIAKIDRAALTGYCYNWATHVWAVRRIDAMNAEDPTGERGRVWNTPSGYKQISVLQSINNRALEQMAKFLAMFGMSPSDRSRVTQSDPQLGLPGVEQPPKADGWGNYQ